MTADQFAQYDAIVLGDNECSESNSADVLAAPLANLATWVPAVSGNIFFSTSDAVYHANRATTRPVRRSRSPRVWRMPPARARPGCTSRRRATNDDASAGNPRRLLARMVGPWQQRRPHPRHRFGCAAHGPRRRQPRRTTAARCTTSCSRGRAISPCTRSPRTRPAVASGCRERGERGRDGRGRWSVQRSGRHDGRAGHPHPGHQHVAEPHPAAGRPDPRGGTDRAPARHGDQPEPRRAEC